MTVDQIVEKFLTKPSYISNGSGKLSRMFKASREDVLEARKIAKKVLKEKVVDAVPEGMVLTSMWQTPSGDFHKAYRKNGEVETKENLSEFKDDLLKELSAAGKVKRFKPTTGDYLLEIAIPDFHFGKIDGTTIEDQADKFVAAGLHLYDKAYNEGVGKVLLPIGNDFFNSEANSQTHKGTPQQNNATFYEMFTKGWTSIVKLVDEISTKTPVDILVIAGNHDTDATIMLGEVLKAYYKNNKMVDVDSDDELTRYYSFGKNLFLYNHGDKIKGVDLPLRMAIEKPILFAECPFRFVRLGHLHKEMHNEVMGIEITRLPSLAKADKWHRDNNYLSQPKSTAVLFHKDYGKSSTYNVYLEHIKL